jgi:hypothetical protein
VLRAPIAARGKVDCADFAFAMESRSGTVLAAKDGCATSTQSIVASCVIGVRFLAKRFHLGVGVELRHHDQHAVADADTDVGARTWPPVMR